MPLSAILSMATFLTSMVFFVLLIFSVILGVSQVSAMASWVSLEMNMLMFVALISATLSNTEAVGMKYFIVQSIGSSFFLGAVSLSVSLVSEGFLMAIISGSLFLKLGAAPLHGWFVSFLGEVSWDVFFVASTFQKILPFYLVAQTYCVWLSAAVGLGALVSVTGSVNQMLTKKLLGYSSVFGTSWMLACESAFSTGVQFLAAYSISLLLVVTIFSAQQSQSLGATVTTSSMTVVFLLMVSLLSLGGSPPFIGFYAKVIVVQEMLSHAQVLWVLILIPSAVFLLYVYMRIFFVALSNWEGSMSAPVESRVLCFNMIVLFGVLPVLPWVLRLSVGHSKIWTFKN